jgi:hypothetical protein
MQRYPIILACLKLFPEDRLPSPPLPSPPFQLGMLCFILTGFGKRGRSGRERCSRAMRVGSGSIGLASDAIETSIKKKSK